MSTLTVYSGTNDGGIQSEDGLDGNYDGTYSLAREGTGEFVQALLSNDVNDPVGQVYWQADYNWIWDVYQGFIVFDTSSIGTGDSISAAVLSITISATIATAGDLEARTDDWGTAVEATDFIAGSNLSGLTLRAHDAWSSFTAYTPNELTDDAMAAGVVKAGSTRLILTTSYQRTATESNSGAYVYYSDQTGTNYDPKLVVTYSSGATYAKSAQAQADIKQRYPYASYPTTVRSHSPISYWRLGDAGSGTGHNTTMVDEMGGHNGSYSNSVPSSPYPAFRTAALVTGGYSVTKYETNYQFIEVGNFSDYDWGNGPYSIEIWFQQGTMATAADQAIFNKGDVNGAPALLIRQNGVLTFDCWGSGDIITGPNILNDYNVKHVVVTKTASSAHMYINGTETGTYTARTTTTNTSSLRWGASSGAGWTPFVGKLSEAAVYNYELTATQVAAHYAESGAGIKGATFAQAQVYIRPRVGLSQAVAYIAGNYTYALDTFTRTVSNNWGTADSGDTWVNIPPLTKYNVTGTEASYSIVAQNFLQALEKTDIKGIIEGHIKFRLNSLPSTLVGIILFSHLSSNTSTNDGNDIAWGYGGKVQVNNTGEITLTYLHGGIGNGIVIVPTYAAGETWHLKVVTGPSLNKMSISIKTWKDGTPEPDWQLSFTGFTGLVNPGGHVGVAISSSDSSGTLYLDDFNYTNYLPKVYGQARATIVSYRAAYAQSKTQIKSISQGYAQVQTRIKTVNRGYAQSKIQIKNISQGFAQIQTRIKAINLKYAQSNTQIKSISQKFAQVQTEIKAKNLGYAQVQTNIKKSSFGLSQVQVNIKKSGSVFGQAQAKLDIAARYSYAQTQAQIKKAVFVFGQIQAAIKETTLVYGQAQARIKIVVLNFAQIQASIKKTSFSFGQAQASIKNINFICAQVQASIKVISNQYAQTGAQVKTINAPVAQASVLIYIPIFLIPSEDITINSWIGVVI